ncbi:MAG TPA: sensor histidine kinase [Longimicrobiales bacterium]|nr:sensor histidine kinase [Longimicrobiales bacterium]
MEERMECPLAGALAERLRDARDDLTRRWLERISARVTLDPDRIFPSKELLDHVPLLVDGIADYMENPADEISADVPVVAKAMELGELRLSQGFSVHEILKEYEILGGVLFSFLVNTVDSVKEECSRGELLSCAQRLFRAISFIQQVTTTQYLRVADEQVREREERLRGFNRMVTHELKNRIAAVRGASAMLVEPWIEDDREQKTRFLSIVARNADGMENILQDLLTLSRTDVSTRRQQNVLLPEVAAEAARQLREMAEEQEVEIRIADDIPPIEVDAAAVELCLVNYISNGIKYADPQKPQRWVEVRAYEEGSDGTAGVVVEVQDNGLGIPVDARDHLFERFFRADNVSDVEGTGLGLNIVQETVESLGGRAWAEPGPDGTSGSIFKIALPARREDDATAADASAAEDAVES